MSHKDIQILKMRYLSGPNIWTYRSVIEAWVDLGELGQFPSNLIPGFYERLTTWLPGLVEHRCGIGERGGFLMRLKDGTWAGHIMEHVALELQTLAGLETGFGKARETSTSGIYKVVIRAAQEEVGRQSLLLAKDLVMSAINDEPYDLKSTVKHMKKLVDKLCLGPSTNCIVEAAVARRIPNIRLTEGNLVQLGYGNKQRRIWTAESDHTSAIAENISSDKDLTKQLLQNCGIPVPEGSLIKSPEEAWSVAQDIGLPVVIKPTDNNNGYGVSLGLNTEEGVKAAFHIADAAGSEVLVERYILGDEHRLLVVGNHLVAATKGETVFIVGDGTHTVAELIELQINSDPRRGREDHFPMDIIRIHENPQDLLQIESQGVKPDTVLEVKRQIVVKRDGNLNNDVTDLVHPEVAAAVCLAARVVGLDIAGVDLVTQDISKPLQDQGGAIVEVNAGPGLLMHLKPLTGKPRPVGQAIIDHLFSKKENGRIPIVGVLGSTQTNLLSHLITWLVHLSGLRVGLACEDGLYMDQRRVQAVDARDYSIGERLLINRTLQAAVFQTSPWHILQDGLPYDRCLVGVVTDMNRQAWDLDEHDIHDEEKFKNVMRTQVDLVLSEGVCVLNAQDEKVLDLAQYSDGEVILYATDPSIEAIQQNRSQGRRSVYFRDGHVVLARGDQETLLFHLDFPPIAARIKQDGFQLETILAGVACAWAMDIAPLLIRAGLKNFGQKPTAAPQEVRTLA